MKLPIAHLRRHNDKSIIPCSRTKGGVAIADRRHGNDGPPESERNGREAGAAGRRLLQPLGVVDERREDDEADDEEEHQQTELVGACAECLYEDL